MDSAEEEDKRYCTWMADLPAHITRVPLNSLAIPGSHDSFSFGLDLGAGVAVDLTGAVKTLGQCCCGVGSSIMKKWAVSQRMNFYQQLECGIRYFDLRVAVKPGTIDVYFLHGLYGPKVIESMRQVREFLDKHTKEVIILDFNHFYNMNQVSHSQFLNMLKDIFQDLMVIPNDLREAGRTTLQELWQTRSRVYIFYHNDVINGIGGFWPGYKIPSPWPITNRYTELLGYQDHIYHNSRRRADNNFYVWQCVVTPRTRDIALHLCGGSLEDTLVSRVAPAMVKWLHGKVAGPSGLNICLGDFVESHHFISTVIDINYKTYRFEH